MYVFLKDEQLRIEETAIAEGECLAEFASYEKAFDFICEVMSDRICQLENEIVELQIKILNLNAHITALQHA